jgi:hypothetical protein
MNLLSTCQRPLTKCSKALIGKAQAGKISMSFKPLVEPETNCSQLVPSLSNLNLNVLLNIPLTAIGEKKGT